MSCFIHGIDTCDGSRWHCIFHSIEYCSSFTRLEAGDVTAGGAPGGVGAKRDPPLWMKPSFATKYPSHRFLIVPIDADQVRR